MSRLRMTKSALAERRRALAGYERALPSLTLKRQQMRVERDAARAAARALEAEAAALGAEAAALPVGEAESEALARLVPPPRITRMQQTRLGVALPAIAAITWDDRDYPLADTPAWFDRALELVRALAEKALAREIAAARVAALDAALKRAVQRVNLLEQVLIPEARRDVARIAIFLADTERTALARAKLAAARRSLAA